MKKLLGMIAVFGFLAVATVPVAQAANVPDAGLSITQTCVGGEVSLSPETLKFSEKVGLVTVSYRFIPVLVTGDETFSWGEDTTYNYSVEVKWQKQADLDPRGGYERWVNVKPAVFSTFTDSGTLTLDPVCIPEPEPTPTPTPVEEDEDNDTSCDVGDVKGFHVTQGVKGDGILELDWKTVNNANKVEIRYTKDGVYDTLEKHLAIKTKDDGHYRLTGLANVPYSVKIRGRDGDCRGSWERETPVLP